MSLNALGNILFGIGSLVCMISGGLWMRAWKGRPTAWASCCRRCGFQLRGLNPTTTACPECGLDLRVASALRPVARQADPVRWGLAVVATILGLLLVQLGSGRSLLRVGRWTCANLSDARLVDAFGVLPTLAATELDARIRSGRFEKEQVAAAADAAAADAAANPTDRGGAGARVLTALRDHHELSPETLTRTLRTTLAGVTPRGGSPRPCRPGGGFIVTASLPSTQGAIWVTRNELLLSITAASVVDAEGVERSLDLLTSGAEGSRREFDGAAFRAPSTPGTYAGRMRITLTQPGGGFSLDTTAPFELTVLDPTQVRVRLASNPPAAQLVREWLGKATLSADAAGSALLVSLPRDLSSLQAQSIAFAGLLQVTQGTVQLDAGRVWIDEALPTVSIFAAPMPPGLDRTRSAMLRFVPDMAFAQAMASSSCTVLEETVEVRIPLPPPPPPAAEPTPNAP